MWIAAAVPELIQVIHRFRGVLTHFQFAQDAGPTVAAKLKEFLIILLALDAHLHDALHALQLRR